MSQATRLGFIGAATLAVAAGYLALYAGRPPQAEAPAIRLGSRNVPLSFKAPKTAQLPPKLVPATPVADLDYKAAYKGATDYMTFAHSILGAAQAGDHKAQYYLAKAMKRCEHAFENKIQGPWQSHWNGVRQSLDEALRFAQRYHEDIDAVQAEYQRCSPMWGAADLGVEGEWLAEATAAGLPLAMDMTAQEILSYRMAFNDFKNIPESAHEPPPVLDSTIDPTLNPNKLFRQAVESKDPEVLLDIGFNVLLLHPGTSDAQSEYLAWALVACDHGLDCGPQGDAPMFQCHWNCDGLPPIEMIRIASSAGIRGGIAAAQWDAVQQRVADINAMLDQGAFDDLGIIPP